jgi:uncharacterized protein YciI
MAGEIPEGLAIESTWVVEAAYAPDATERRPAVRSEHLARVAKLRDAGTIIEAGGFSDMSGSLFLIRASSEAAALEILEEDVYRRTGIWTGFRVRPMGRVVRSAELPPS